MLAPPAAGLAPTATHLAPATCLAHLTTHLAPPAAYLALPCLLQPTQEGLHVTLWVSNSFLTFCMWAMWLRLQAFAWIRESVHVLTYICARLCSGHLWICSHPLLLPSLWCTLIQLCRLHQPCAFSYLPHINAIWQHLLCLLMSSLYFSYSVGDLLLLWPAIRRFCPWQHEVECSAVGLFSPCMYTVFSSHWKFIHMHVCIINDASLMIARCPQS